MKLSEIISKYGDCDVPYGKLVELGFISHDEMLNANDVSGILHVKRGCAYRIIKEAKASANLEYSEAIIPKSMLCRMYGMKEW